MKGKKKERKLSEEINRQENPDDRKGNDIQVRRVWREEQGGRR